MRTFEELLALDLLTLRDHTERAGDTLDPELHASRLRESLQVSQVCAVRRGDGLVAYAMLRPETDSCWFVGAFNTHPLHRTSAVMLELFTLFPKSFLHSGPYRIIAGPLPSMSAANKF